MRKKRQGSLIHPGISLSSAGSNHRLRADKRAAKPEETGESAISLPGELGGERAPTPFRGAVPLVRGRALPTRTRACPRAPGFVRGCPWSLELTWPVRPPPSRSPSICMRPSRGRHHSFPKPACIHFHNFLFHYNINGTINGKGQEKHF